MPKHATHWHHAPVHSIIERGAYIVTAGTYNKVHFFTQPDRLQFLHDSLLAVTEEFGWELHAWAVFPNHYHFVGVSPADPTTLRPLLRKLHANTARSINETDKLQGRKVWHQFWDTRLTYEGSYFARLHYVHANAVHHRLVRVPSQYAWCSAARFENEAPATVQKMIYSLPIDQVTVEDNF